MQNPLTLVTSWLDRTTMYRVVIYTLLGLAALSVPFSLTGLISYTILELVVSLVVLLVVSLGTNWAFAHIFKAPTNHESTLITALILFFLFNPSLVLFDIGVLVAASVLAVFSKYMFAAGKQHILNPAAAGAFLTAFLFGFWGESVGAGWWIATSAYTIPVLIAALLVVHKIRREMLFAAFLLASFLVSVGEGMIGFGDNFMTAATFWIVSTPILFLGGYMLTEPFTTPGTKWTQVLYGVVVGILAAGAGGIETITGVGGMTPEIALLVANLIFWPTLLRQKLILNLLEKRTLANGIIEFIFKKPAHMAFSAGQYLEWTLPHQNADRRGIRRYFTIASAPNENTLRLGVRVSPTDQKGSSFKTILQQFQPGDTLYASQRAGDFTLPSDKNAKIVMIAGGIGVTPFRSHVADMIATGDTRETVLFYANKTAADVAYLDIWQQAAAEINFKAVHVITEGAPLQDAICEDRYIDQAMLETHCGDYKTCQYYLSGPTGMVNAYKKMLKKSGIKSSQITTDYFPGLA